MFLKHKKQKYFQNKQKNLRLHNPLVFACEDKPIYCFRLKSGASIGNNTSSSTKYIGKCNQLKAQFLLNCPTSIHRFFQNRIDVWTEKKNR